MSYRLDYDDRGFIASFFGKTTIDDLNRCNGEIQGHADFDTHRYQIIDLRQANLSVVTFGETQEPASIDAVASETNHQVRLALVPANAYDDEICREFANQSIQFGSPWTYRIFHSFEEALQWAKDVQG